MALGGLFWLAHRTSSAGSKENLPINCVNWWESYAFCIWDGGFLPSEAEWGNTWEREAVSSSSTHGAE
jgi:formylglycine-generating enzyme required for sulfatase activity